MKIKFGDFNALNLEDASYMIWGASNLEEVTFNSLSTPKLKRAQQMISTTYNLKKLELKGFSAAEDAYLYCTFCGNQALEYIDLSSFETTDSQYLGYIFGNTKLTTGYAKTQADADRFNNRSVTAAPDTVTFVVKPQEGD